MTFVHSIDPLMIQLGPLGLYWYSLFFALGVLLCYLLLKRVFRREGLPQRQAESLMIYAIVGMFIGARLGYVFFYQYDYFLANPLEAFKLWKPGLSSHGAAMGVLASVLVWSWIWRQNFFRALSLLSLGLPIILVGVRVGNFINSEAAGIPTSADWGVVFKRLGEDFPRHPSQLYEALVALLILLLLHWYYRQYGIDRRPAMLLFLFGVLYFSSRFLLEFWKPGKILNDSFPFSVEQVLSIPPVIVALCFFLWVGIRKRNG